MPDTQPDPQPQPPAETPTENGRSLRNASAAALPTLFTVLNGVLGFTAIHFATQDVPFGKIQEGQQAAMAWVHHRLWLAAGALLLAMVCDALDGRLARLTRKTSDFGEQLDSLCDAISFGVAPVFLMLRAVHGTLFSYVGEIGIHGSSAFGKVFWLIGAVYVSCTLLRLARFNVETESDITSHMEFKGLPSPAAALTLVSMVLLHSRLIEIDIGWRSSPWMTQSIIWAMPGVTLLAAMLMVSGFKYTHVFNKYMRGGKSFGFLAILVVVVLVAVVFIQETLAVVALGYMFSGPVGWVYRRARGRAKA